MRDIPILFSGPMARAIRAGLKTQTRRPMKPQPHPDFLARGVVGVVPQWPMQDGVRWFMADGMSESVKCPYGAPGDQIYVKEATWVWCEKRPAGIQKSGRQAFRYIPVGRHVVYIIHGDALDTLEGIPA